MLIEVRRRPQGMKDSSLSILIANISFPMCKILFHELKSVLSTLRDGVGPFLCSFILSY